MLPAPGAEVVVVAPAVNRDEQPREASIRVQALTTDLRTHRAHAEPDGQSILVLAPEPTEFLQAGWAATLSQVARHVPTIWMMEIRPGRDGLTAGSQLVGGFDLDDRLQSIGEQEPASGRCPISIRGSCDTEVRRPVFRQHEGGLQSVPVRLEAAISRSSRERSIHG